MKPLALLGLSVAAALPAQTYIVDAAAGPGTTFTSIATATVFAPNGAVLLVRPGSYDPFSVSGKALTILGQPGVQVQGPFFGLTSVTVTSTSATQTVVIRDVTLRSSFGGPVHLDCTACAGPVLLDSIALDTALYPGTEKLLTVQNCAQLAMQGCGAFFAPMNATRAAIEVTGSNAVLQGCTIDTVFGCSLRASASTVQLVDATHIAGGGQPVVDLIGSSLQVIGTSRLEALAPLSIATVLGGSGTTTMDPAVTLIGNVTSGVTVVVTPQAVVRATGGRLGTAAQATMTGPPGQLGTLLLGALGPRQSVPGFTNPTWIAAGSFAAGPVGVFGPPLQASVLVPNQPALLGQVFVWQGATHAPATGFALSNPVVFTP